MGVLTPSTTLLLLQPGLGPSLAEFPVLYKNRRRKMCVHVRACVRVCVRASLRACVRVRACVCLRLCNLSMFKQAAEQSLSPALPLRVSVHVGCYVTSGHVRVRSPHRPGGAEKAGMKNVYIPSATQMKDKLDLIGPRRLSDRRA